MSPHVLQQIFNVCGAKRLGHFGRSQFYIALKLVALAQNGYELSLENLNKPNLPLPRRLVASIQVSTGGAFDKSRHQPLNSLDSYSSVSANSTPSGILPPPKSSKSTRLKQKLSPAQQLCKFCNKNLMPASTADQDKNLKTFVLICPNCKHSNQNSPNELNPVERLPNNKAANKQNLSDLTSSDDSRCSSTELYETIDDTSLAFEKTLKPWEKIEQSNQDYVGSLDDTDEAKHCLLNDEEEQVETNKICLNVKNSYDQYDSPQYDSNYYKSAPIEEETDEDVWSINDQQIRYYYEKFCQLLPATHAKLLAGCSVKSFFEKSKLSLNDLKQIWNLSDLDADGHLSIIEFCIAMHLVVLKRNQVPLPDPLPSSLQPLKINQLLQRNQLIVPDDQPSFNAINSNLTPDNTSLQPNYYQSTGNISSINVSSSNVSSSNVSINQPHLRNSFDNIKSGTHLRNQQETGNTSALLGANETELTINSPNNREWTKFNNSPFTTQLNRQLNNQQNNLQSSDDVNCLIAPANFTDKIELDPTLIHPLAVKVSSNQQFVDTQLVNKDSSRVFSAAVLKYVSLTSQIFHLRISSNFLFLWILLLLQKVYLFQVYLLSTLPMWSLGSFQKNLVIIHIEISFLSHSFDFMWFFFDT